MGAAFVHQSTSHSWSLDEACSIFYAELYAIWQALLYVMFSSFKKTVICLDSLSAITSLENTFTNTTQIKRILELNNHLNMHVEREYTFYGFLDMLESLATRLPMNVRKPLRQDHQMPTYTYLKRI